MNILYDKRFVKDIEAINDKRLRHQVEVIISEIEKAEQLITLRHLKKMKGA